MLHRTVHALKDTLGMLCWNKLNLPRPGISSLCKKHNNMYLLMDKSDGDISGWQKWLKAAYCQTLLRVHQCALSDRITEYLFRECIKTHDYRHLGLSVCFSILKMNRFFYATVVMRNSSMYFSIITMFSYIYKHIGLFFCHIFLPIYLQ